MRDDNEAKMIEKRTRATLAANCSLRCQVEASTRLEELHGDPNRIIHLMSPSRASISRSWQVEQFDFHVIATNTSNARRSLTRQKMISIDAMLP